MKKFFFVAVSIVVLFFVGRGFVSAQEADKLKELNQKIAEYEQQVKNLQSQANTLSNQIAQFDAQINLTQLKIDQTEQQVVLLGGRINELEGSLESLSEAFKSRAVETYKMARVGSSVVTLIASENLSQAVSRFNYLRRIQESDRDLMVRLQSAQNVYKNQKEELEKLQEQLKSQRLQLDSQKKAKANLLAITKNDEKKYQQLLSSAKAELEAIQAIIAGRGEEMAAGHANENDRIATIISGASCNSSGAHLHFIVSENGQTKNPFQFLKGIDYENCSGSSCGSSDGDPFNPRGSWNWPLSSKIKFSQGYGVTWAVNNTWAGKVYNFHNGIDINGGSNEVKAVRSGNLFRGSYNGSGGCKLRYVRVDHDENNLETFYLHVNY